MEEMTPSYFSDPLTMVIFGIPILLISAFFLYYLMRWVFSIRKILVLLEGIYEKSGGDVQKLYSEKIKSPLDFTGTSFDPKNPQ